MGKRICGYWSPLFGNFLTNFLLLTVNSTLFLHLKFDLISPRICNSFCHSFGKFGIFTCFDIFSHDPAMVVVDEFQVDSVLYPTAWYNTLPLLSAVPFHSAWARSVTVNLLAANTHNTRMHMTGNSQQSRDNQLSATILGSLRWFSNHTFL